MRKFYLIYPIGKTVPAKLICSHYSEYKLHMLTEQELISAVEEEEKNFELNEKI